MTCELRTSPRCRRAWSIEERLANETRANSGGRIICRFCSIATKRGLDDGLLDAIDTEEKAYLLGWIASDGAIQKSSIAVFVNKRDKSSLERIRDIACHSLPLARKRELVGFTINSRQIVEAVSRWLDMPPGKKSSTIGFPQLPTTELTWAFLRGLFDGDGCISSVEDALRRAEKRGGTWPAPRCSIASSSPRFLDGIQEFAKVPASRGRDQLLWSDANALDFMGKLYRNATCRLARKYELYLDWCSWVPAARSPSPAHPLFRWARTMPEAIPPSKSSPSDSGFDLTLIGRSHRHGAVEFYRTGIKVQPAFGWYFDLVPRSSISKSGYMLANGVGVIDRGYTGEIFVPLIKVDPSAAELALPARLVQIIPRSIIAAELVEVADLDDTIRGAGGFGSTG